MYPAILSIITWVVLTIRSIQAAEYYHLDNSQVCQKSRVLTKWLEDDDVIVIFGKLNSEQSFKECEIKFGPARDVTKLSTLIQFETYFNNECSVYLLFEQSPYQFFEKEVSTVVNLTCWNTPGSAKFYTDAGSNLRIILYKSHSHLRNYNFKFNITLTNHETETHVSSAIIIVVGIIVVIIIPLLGCIVYKALKIKRWSKRHYAAEHDQSPHSHQPLRHLDGHSMPPSVRYSSMPLGDQETADSIHSQTCIVGTQGADGRCTVCHRNHEDFAHVVDVDSQGLVLEDTTQCRLCHRSHEDFVHFEEINTNSNNQSTGSERIVGRVTQPSLSANPNPGQRNPTRHYRRPTGQQSQRHAGNDDDDDIYVVRNDLIPPSYDLCPPSYDEAVDMPTPDSVGNRGSQGNLETDPLYQNIDDVLASRS